MRRSTRYSVREKLRVTLAITMLRKDFENNLKNVASNHRRFIQS